MDITVKDIAKKMMKMIKKKKKMQNLKENRFLVSINVVGSTGPIRFIVREDETVTNVVDNTLRCYARQGRLPVFSSHCTSSFLLYSPAGPLNPCAKIGSTGSMNFIMYKSPEDLENSTYTTRKTSGKWRAWLNDSPGLLKLTSQVFGISFRCFLVPT